MARDEANSGFKNSKGRVIFMSKSKTGKVSYFTKSGDKKVYGVKAHTKNGKTVKGNTTVPNKIRPAVRKGGATGPRRATVVRNMVGNVMKRVTAGNKPSNAMARNARAARKGAMKARGVGGVVRNRSAAVAVKAMAKENRTARNFMATVAKANKKAIADKKKAANKNAAAATRRFGAMMKKLNQQKAKSDARKVVKARVAANKAANKEAMTATRRYAKMMKTLNSQKGRAEAAKLRRRNAAAAKALAKEEEKASQLFFRAMSANARKAAAATKKAASAAAKKRANYARKALAAPGRPVKRAMSAGARRTRRAALPKRAMSARAIMGPRRVAKPKPARKPRKVASPKRKLTKSERSVVAKIAASRMSVSAKARRAQKAANTRKYKKGLLNANPFAALTKVLSPKPRRSARK